MLVEVVTDDPVDTCARKLRIAGALVGEADVQRSTLLQEIALLTGQTEIAISDESFQLWKRFYSDCPSSFRELVSVVRVASFLRDEGCVAEAARHLAAALRAALRSTFTAPPVTALRHLPAIDPAPGVAIHTHPTVTDLSALPPHEAAAVLHLLHPLELYHLPEPLISTALYAHASSAIPFDLRAPGSCLGRLNLPHWETHCQFTLSALLNRPGSPVAALCLSHLSRATAAYLRDLAPRLASLRISHSNGPPVLTFLTQATALTHLDINVSHTPRASLLDSLLGLPHLHTLILHVPALTASDLERLATVARFSPAAVMDSPALQPLSHTLAPIAHASLVQVAAPATPDACWPPLLSCLFDFSKLRSFTCFPARLSPPHPLHTGPPPLRLVSLAFPPAPGHRDWQLMDELVHDLYQPDADALVVAASAPTWAPLTHLDLHACTSAATIAALLCYLPQLRHLSLGCCPPAHLSAVQRSLPSLPHLKSLALKPVDHSPAGVDSLFNMLSALHAAHLTRLHIVHAPPPLRCIGPVTALPGLEDLQWGCPATQSSGRSMLEADAAAAAAVLCACTALSTLRIALPALLQHAHHITTALADLRRLQRLHLDLFCEAVGMPWPCSEPLHLPELQELTVLFDHPQALLEQTMRLGCWHAQALTRLRLSPSPCAPSASDGDIAYASALAAVLPRFLKLQGLHVPLDVFSAAPDEAAEVLGPALARLTRLERLDACKADNGFVQALWPYLRCLPLRQGFL